MQHSRPPIVEPQQDDRRCGQDMLEVHFGLPDVTALAPAVASDGLIVRSLNTGTRNVLALDSSGFCLLRAVHSVS